MTEPKPVIKVPDITPELLEKNEAEQNRWRQFYRLPALSVDKYAELVISANLETLDVLHLQMKRANNQTRRAIKLKSQQIRRDTAVWLASLGQFEAAFNLAVTKAARRKYRSFIEAVKKTDSDWCEHPLFEFVSGAASQVAYREFDFYSERHGRRVSMVCCRKCGFRNARDLDSELRKISEHRAQTVATAKDVSRENVALKLQSEGLLRSNLAEIIK